VLEAGLYHVESLASGRGTEVLAPAEDFAFEAQSTGTLSSEGDLGKRLLRKRCFIERPASPALKAPLSVQGTAVVISTRQSHKVSLRSNQCAFVLNSPAVNRAI